MGELEERGSKSPGWRRVDGVELGESHTKKLAWL